jgi:CRP-like cAMP-binding protein
MAAPGLAVVHARAKSPFLEGLAPSEIEAVLAAAREVRFSAGTVIATQGTPANSLYLLLKGTETVRDSTLLFWDRPTIRRLVQRYPRLLENALFTATEYLAFYVATHIALTCHTGAQRIAAILLTLAEGIGRHTTGGIELDVTNEELAEAANVTHFTASRLISAWQRAGALVKTRGRILLRPTGKLLLARLSAEGD